MQKIGTGDIVRLKDRPGLWVAQLRGTIGGRAGWRCVTADREPAQAITVARDQIEIVAKCNFKIGQVVKYQTPYGTVDAEVIGLERDTVRVRFDQRHELRGGVGFILDRGSIAEPSRADLVLQNHSITNLNRRTG